MWWRHIGCNQMVCLIWCSFWYQSDLNCMFRQNQQHPVTLCTGLWLFWNWRESNVYGSEQFHPAFSPVWTTHSYVKPFWKSEYPHLFLIKFLKITSDETHLYISSGLLECWITHISLRVGDGVPEWQIHWWRHGIIFFWGEIVPWWSCPPFQMRSVLYWWHHRSMVTSLMLNKMIRKLLFRIHCHSFKSPLYTVHLLLFSVHQPQSRVSANQDTKIQNIINEQETL